MKEKIKVAYIGLGRRGSGLLYECFSKMPDVEITVLCDSYEPALKHGAELMQMRELACPILTTDADEAINTPGIDAVIITTGWHEHTMLAEKAMLAGKYTAIEVGCAFDLHECHKIIDAHEKTGAPLMMLENCCYGRLEMMALNMAKKGLFGEVVHCCGGYHHNLPESELFYQIQNEYRHYRLASYISRNCEQYPTHELGPISKLLNINRGNRMMTLSSFASKGGGLKRAAKNLLGEDSVYANIDYKQGDIITTVITCAGGETIHLCLDTTTPRPYYSRNFTVRGTAGMCSEERRTVFLEGMEEPVEDNFEEMYPKYDHPLHEEYQKLGAQGSHDGMDWLVCRAFVESVKNGTDTPIDVYDSALWLSIAPLSEASIAKGGMPVEIPDFTKGKWIRREPGNTGKYSLDEIVVDNTTPIYPK